jgi:outer membrane receptor for monomeric catechols
MSRGGVSAMAGKRLLRLRVARLAKSTATLLLVVCQAVSGQVPQAEKDSRVSSADLTQVSLENLMNVEAPSVSKKEQKMSQVAAAIFVITQEDIHRSGATNISDLLRMVPGMDAAEINSNTWAISAPGFNFQFASKLLVLIDGRAVYTPRGFAWDANAYFVGRLPAQFVASYTRLDTQLTWRVQESVGLSLVEQNLLRDHHLQFNDTFQSVNSSQVKRSAYVKLTWQF